MKPTNERRKPDDEGLYVNHYTNIGRLKCFRAILKPKALVSFRYVQEETSYEPELHDIEQLSSARRVFWTIAIGAIGGVGYHEDGDFTAMPAWDDNDELTGKSHRAKISLIYYSQQGSLEDRIYRIKRALWASLHARAAHTHFIANLEVLSQDDNKS